MGDARGIAAAARVPDGNELRIDGRRPAVNRVWIADRKRCEDEV